MNDFAACVAALSPEKQQLLARLIERDGRSNNRVAAAEGGSQHGQKQKPRHVFCGSRGRTTGEQPGHSGNRTTRHLVVTQRSYTNDHRVPP